MLNRITDFFKRLFGTTKKNNGLTIEDLLKILVLSGLFDPEQFQERAERGHRLSGNLFNQADEKSRETKSEYELALHNANFEKEIGMSEAKRLEDLANRHKANADQNQLLYQKMLKAGITTQNTEQ